MKIDVLPDSDTVALEMAKFIAAEARAATLAWGRFLFAVSGGPTPWLMLRALAGEAMPGRKCFWSGSMNGGRRGAP